MTQTPREQVRAWLDVAELVHYEDEAMTPEDLAPLDEVDVAMEAVKLWRAAHLQKQAAEAVLAVVGNQLAELIGDGGAAAIGDNIVRYRQKRTPKCIDPDGWGDYVHDAVLRGDVEITEIVNPDYAKRSWMSDAVRDTFYENVTDEHPSLQIVPRDRAPRFLQDLGDGEVLIKRKEE